MNEFLAESTNINNSFFLFDGPKKLPYSYLLLFQFEIKNECLCRQTISYVVPYKFADAHLSAFYHPSSITSSTGGKKLFETVEFVHFTILIPLFNNEITV